MISLEEAQARIFALKSPVELESVPLADAVGRWAASDVVALRTQPARDLSAMDGYAIRFANAEGPWRLIGESAAGRKFAGVVGADEAVRIFTGAVMPAGADSVIIQENVTRDGEMLRVSGDAPNRLGQHVRIAGSDFDKGAVLVPKGAEFHARHLALAAMGGHHQILVRRPVKVALISTGDELVQLGEACADDQIPSSNAVMLASILSGLPLHVEDAGIVRDDLESLTAAFEKVRDADIIVTTGGASVGDHDLILPALKAAGGAIDFWKIAMRPGKPVIAGRLGKAALLGLPGNPVSAFVTAFLLLLPMIRHLCGSVEPLPLRLTGQLGVDLPANGHRADHLRARMDNGILTLVGADDSAMLAALSYSNALIIRDINTPATVIGTKVSYYPLV